ncbi:MAG: CvpA family protein [Holosporales bacterium]|nr:CvpA family protein [Holosporales bacterium]
MESFNFFSVDSFIVIAILISIVIGMIRGSVKEILSLVSWGGSALLTMYLFPYGKEIAREHIKHGLIADIITICILFVVFLTILSILNYICSGIVKKSVFNGVDRFLGGIFGVIRGVIILAAIDMATGQWIITDTSPDWLNGSKLRPHVVEVANFIILMLPEETQNIIVSRMSYMNKQNLMKFLYNGIPLSNKNEELLKAEAVPQQKSPTEENDYNGEEEDTTVIVQDAKKLATLTPKPVPAYNTDESVAAIRNRPEKEQLDMERIIDQELLESDNNGG